MWENMTFDNIMSDMLDKVDDDMDKRQGSVIWDALAPAAMELEAAYLVMEYTLNQAFPDTAEREYLIRKATERGLTPNAAVAAVIKGVFTPSTVDVSDLRFSLGNENFVVGDAIEGEAGAYELTCETAGTEGNVSLGTLIPIDNVEGLETAIATEFITLGEDEEETETFRERVLNSYTAIGFGGNVQDYINKCMEIEGIGGVRIEPAWNGGGTVKIYVLDDEYNLADSNLIETVQNTINKVVPIGHVVTVVAPITLSVNFKVSLDYETGYGWELVKDDVTDVLTNYLYEIRKNWGGGDFDDSIILRISTVTNLLFNINGVAGVNSVRILGMNSNITVDNDRVPFFGGVTTS